MPRPFTPAVWALAPLAAAIAAAGAQEPAPVAERIEAARTLHAKGDLAGAARALEDALEHVHQALARRIIPAMPPAPEGWNAEQAEAEGGGLFGGGLTITRGYHRGEAILDATAILDGPAVAAAADMLAAPALPDQPGFKRLDIDGQPALLRWDDAVGAGEVTMVLDGRVLLQVEGDGLDSREVLVETARGWDVTAIRGAVGL